MLTTINPLLQTKSFPDLCTSTEEKLRVYAFTNRVALEPLFSDFDRLNSNKITVDQFKRGLVASGAVLHVAEVDALVKQYSVSFPEKSVTLVDWRKFCDSINEVFAPNIKVKSPSLSVLDSSALIKTQRQTKIDEVRTDKFAEVKGDDHPVLSSTMQFLKDDALKRRLFAKSFFKEFDKLNRGVVTRTQFQRCLSVLGWDLSEDQMRALHWKYCTEAADFVNYRAFLADIDPPQHFGSDDCASSSGGGWSGVATARPVEHSTLQGLIKTLQAEVFRRRLYLKDMFQDHDQLRCGVVPATRFASVIDVIAQIKLSAADMKLLINQYANDKHVDGVNYLQFVSDIEAVYTNPKVDRAPLDTAPDQATIRELLNEVDQKPYETPEESKAITNLMANLVKMVADHSIHHKPFFQSMDKTNCGMVSISQFAAVLSTLKIHVTPAEVKLLQLRYGRANDLLRIRYIPFCQDLDFTPKQDE